MSRQISKPETQIVKTVPIASKVEVSSKLEMKMRANLCQYMYEIAKKHSELAKRIAGKDRSAEVKESLISVVFAYTCLEAYINSLGRDKLAWTSEKLKATNLESKWQHIPDILAEKAKGRIFSVYNKRNEPFKSFLKLKSLREDFIHWKAEFGDVQETKYGRMDGTINQINSEVAEWASNVVIAMIKKLHEIIGEPPSWIEKL